MNAHGQTIGLNMIVKNEAHVIRRCIDSLRGSIDRWVIADTGSTDGTQEIIREALAGIPGSLIERPWVDFSHNRNEVLEHARKEHPTDYTLQMDADDMLVVGEDFAGRQLKADVYDVELVMNSTAYLRRVLLRGGLPWSYRGVLHEYIHCPEAQARSRLPRESLHIRVMHEGARSRDPMTYRRDALVLERALIDDPDNARHVFYLAQSYRDAGDPELALRHYRRRAEMGDWREEAWYSLYQIAAMLERLGKPWPEVLAAYLAAFEFDPGRAEPLYWIGRHYQAAREFHTARLFFARGLRVPEPRPDRLFVDLAIHDYLLRLEYAVTCYYTGDHAEAIAVDDDLLRAGKLPENQVDLVRRNRQFSVNAMGPSASIDSPEMDWSFIPETASAVAVAHGAANGRSDRVAWASRSRTQKVGVTKSR